MNDQTKFVTPEKLRTHCTILKESESFQWWLEKCVLEPMAEADERRSDLSLTESQRTNALVEWLRLQKQSKFLAESEEAAVRQLPPVPTQ